MDIKEQWELEKQNKVLSENLKNATMRIDAMKELLYKLANRARYYSDLREIIHIIEMPIDALELYYESTQAEYGKDTEMLTGKIAEAVKLQQLMKAAELGRYFVGDWQYVPKFTMTKAGILRGVKCE